MLNKEAWERSQTYLKDVLTRLYVKDIVKITVQDLKYTKANYSCMWYLCNCM